MVNAGAHVIGDTQLARLDIAAIADRGDQFSELDLRPPLGAAEGNLLDFALAGGGVALGIEFQFPATRATGANVASAHSFSSLSRWIRDSSRPIRAPSARALPAPLGKPFSFVKQGRTARLEGNHTHPGQRLQHLAAAHQAAPPRQSPDAKRGRRSARQPQPARAGDDQHCQTCEQRLVEGNPARPEEHRDGGKNEHRGHERARDPVGQTLRGTRVSQRLPDRMDDLRPTGRGGRPRRCGSRALRHD